MMRAFSQWLIASLLAAVLPIGLIAPVAAQDGAATASITREQFRQLLLQTFPMEEPAQRGGQLIVGEIGDIDTLNPMLANSTPTFYITGSIYETLVGASPIDGQPVPALADSWEVAADGRTYTFHLNQSATWHDGADVTAEDAKFSFDAVLDPNTGSSYTSLVSEAVESYRVVDADTFEIVARDRLVSFLYDAPGSVFIVPKHIWEAVGFESWSVDGGSTGFDPSRVVGTGPFKFKEWVQGDHVTLMRNDGYYDGPPYLDEFILRVLPDSIAAVQALKTGEIDVMEIIPAPEVKGVKETGQHKIAIYPLFDVTFYMYNFDQEKQFFQDQRVRQALLQAIDRQLIRDTIFVGYGQVAVGMQPELSPAFAPDRMTAQYPYDPEAGRRLLEEAGWQLNGDGIREKDGQKFEITLIFPSGDATVESMATEIQRAWSEVGIKVKVEPQPGDVLLQNLEAHTFDLALLAFGFTPEASQTLLFTCNAYTTGFNFMHYCNERYDELDNMQKREFDRANRIALLIEQSNIIWTDLPVGPLRFGVGRTGYTNRLHNFYPNGYGFLWSLAYVWIEH